MQIFVSFKINNFQVTGTRYKRGCSFKFCLYTYSVQFIILYFHVSSRHCFNIKTQLKKASKQNRHKYYSLNL